MFSLLHGHEEAAIREDVQFLRTHYDEDDTKTQEDLCYDKAAKGLLISSQAEAASLRFWRSIHHCGLAYFDSNVIPSITALLTSYDPSHLNGKTQLQLLAVVYGRVLAEWPHHGRPQSSRRKIIIEEFIVEGINLGLDLHEAFRNCTPLKAMLTCFTCFWDQGEMVPQSELHKALIAWLRLLERAGVNLSEYGKKDFRSFQTHQFSQTPRSTFEDWFRGVFEDSSWWKGEGTMLLFALTCGRRSSDWQIVLLGLAEEYLQDFWQMVETQTREASFQKYVPPGGWIDN